MSDENNNIPEPSIPNWIKILNQYETDYYQSGKIVKAEEWNALFAAAVAQGNYHSNTLDLLINTYLPEKWEEISEDITEFKNTVNADITEIEEAVQQANTNASTAVSNSTSAIQTANTANSKADSAVQTANTAIGTANSAKTTAEAISGIAEDAKEIAEETQASLTGYYTKTETDTLFSNLIDGAPEQFDTLKEISDWIANDETGTAALINRVSNIETDLTDVETNITNLQNNKADVSALPDVSGFVTESDLTGRVIPEGVPGNYRFSSTHFNIGKSNSYVNIDSNGIITASGVGANGKYIRIDGRFNPSIEINSSTLKYPSSGYGIEYENNNTNTVYNLDDVATETSLEGRVIPEGSANNITNTTINWVASNTITDGVKVSNTTNTNYALLNQDSLTFFKSGDSLYRRISNAYPNSLRYMHGTLNIDFDNICSKITGDNLESGLTGYSFGIGQVLICSEDSTSGAYKQGHLYLIGGTNGSYTATDITPAAEIDTSQFVTEESLTGRVSPDTTKVIFNEDGSARFYGSSTSNYTNISGSTITLKGSGSALEHFDLNASGINFAYGHYAIYQALNDPGHVGVHLRDNSNSNSFRYSFKDLIPAMTDSEIASYTDYSNSYRHLAGEDIIVFCKEKTTENEYLLNHFYKIHVDKTNTPWQYTVTDVTVSGSSVPSITVDSELSSTSENPVQNKVIAEALSNKVEQSNAANTPDGGSTISDISIGSNNFTLSSITHTVPVGETTLETLQNTVMINGSTMSEPILQMGVGEVQPSTNGVNLTVTKDDIKITKTVNGVETVNKSLFEESAVDPKLEAFTDTITSISTTGDDVGMSSKFEKTFEKTNNVGQGSHVVSGTATYSDDIIKTETNIISAEYVPTASTFTKTISSKADILWKSIIPNITTMYTQALSESGLKIAYDDVKIYRTQGQTGPTPTEPTTPLGTSTVEYSLFDLASDITSGLLYKKTTTLADAYTELQTLVTAGNTIMSVDLNVNTDFTVEGIVIAITPDGTNFTPSQNYDFSEVVGLSTFRLNCNDNNSKGLGYVFYSTQGMDNYLGLIIGESITLECVTNVQSSNSFQRVRALTNPPTTLPITIYYTKFKTKA